MRRAIIVDDERLARRRLKRLLDALDSIEVVAECSNGLEAVEILRGTSVDVVFLDVKMPALDGFEVIEAVGVDDMPPVVFVTAYEHYAIRAFADNALDYLVKPIDQARLERTVERLERLDRGASQRLSSMLEGRRREGPRSRFLAKEPGRVVIVPADEIDFVSSEGNYVRLHTSDDSYLLRETMERLSEQLGPEFVRIHRQTSVRIGLIREVLSLAGGEIKVQLSRGTQLSVGRRYRAALSRVLS